MSTTHFSSNNSFSSPRRTPPSTRHRRRTPNSSRRCSRPSAPSPINSPKSAVSAPCYWLQQQKQEKQQEQQQNAAQAKADYLRYALATFSPLYFATQFLGFTPDPAQAKILDSAPHFLRIGLNCNRQWGKSTLAAILIAHRLVTQPGSTVLIVAPAGRQAGETQRKVEDFLSILAIPFHNDGTNPRSAQLPNGSRVISLPAVERTSRGFSAVSMLVFDEASRIHDRIYLAFRPMLAVSHGDLILVSTPHGKRGFFYREMAAQTPNWLRHTGPISESIHRIGQQAVDEERAQGEAYFRQEWLCEFVETGRYAIDESLLHKIIKDSVEAYAWI